ncbi:hypothetical protein THAOC_14011 [Thalassiosira oceanica]|uniref:Methyltransferase domain-containing protein n=1 Tax=Thalassiosira oceanica TaxID=159749 RepID=K0SGC6_THAOC|nr:hypothetical protein THAOC_14011 [Thalassiosira oceanica]|eukprot:EJK65168.1 hypothetical protein THAOC_14011 [Thalassiosira oceanica]
MNAAKMKAMDIDTSGINSIIADPRTPNFRRLFKSVQFLLNYPEECELRAEENRPTHQPLARLLMQLQQSTNDANIDAPSYMRIYVDETLVEMLRSVISREEANLERWDEYWNGRRDSIEANSVHYGGTAPRDASSLSERCGNQIRDPRRALEALLGLDFVCGFHPDQATEAAVDLALLLKKPFAVVPCCVFPSEFPDRRLDGERVKTHVQLVEHLTRKHDKIKTATLPFIETDTAKNVVVYLLAEDV